jgi:hypothetical protein
LVFFSFHRAVSGGVAKGRTGRERTARIFVLAPNAASGDPLRSTDEERLPDTDSSRVRRCLAARERLQ